MCRVVSQLEVASRGVLVLSKPGPLSELKTYALKQKRRVGAG